MRCPHVSLPAAGTGTKALSSDHLIKTGPLMDQNIKAETLIAVSLAVFAVLGAIAFLVPFENRESRLFFIGLAAALTAINVAGLFMVWRSTPTIVDEVFLMTPTGMLLKQYTRRLRPDQDQALMAGVLTAAPKLFQDRFGEG